MRKAATFTLISACITAGVLVSPPTGDNRPSGEAPPVRRISAEVPVADAPDPWLPGVAPVDPWQIAGKPQLWQAAFFGEDSPAARFAGALPRLAKAPGTGKAALSPSAADPPGRRTARSPGPYAVPEFRPAGTGGMVTKAEVDALKDGLDAVLAQLEASVVDQVFSETLPVVGDRFTEAFDTNTPAFRYVDRVRTAARDGLATLTTAGPFTPAQVAAAINAKLTAAAFNAGSLVTVTTANDHVQLAFATNDSFTAVLVPIAADFGIPHLDLDLIGTASASTALSAVLNFTAGIDSTGFYLETAAPQTFTLNTTTGLSTTLNAPVRFAKLPYRLNDDTSPRSSITANFVLTLRDPDNSGKIRLDELSGTPDLIDGTVSGQAALSLAITSDLPDTAAFPKIRTELALTWIYTAPQVLNPEDDNATFGSALSLHLNTTGINVRSFFRSFAHRVLRGIADVTSPLNPLIDILTAEIPLLSDLGSEAVTILDVAGASEDQVAAIGGLAALSSLARFATESTTADTVWMNMGSYVFQGADLRTADLDELQGGLTAAALAPPADMPGFLSRTASIEGLEFPLLKDGYVLANLLMGRPADLFTYKSGGVLIEQEFGAFYPVLGPIGVTLGGRAGVKTRFGFGFDSQGVFDFAEAGPGADPALLFNGFYAMTEDENGDPFTGITLFAGITAGVEANLVLASVGVEGDITAEIGMYLDSPPGDDPGRVRGDTISSVPFEDLFYAYGSLSAGLRAYVEVGFSPFSIGYDWESPRVVLINFDSRDTNVPVLATPEGETLRLNVGARSPLRIHGNLDDRAEEFTIAAGVQGILVGAFDAENTFTDPVSLITASPAAHGDLIEVQPDVTVPVRFRGGEGRDILSGGAVADELYGDEDPDVLRGRGGSDLLFGGGDNDELIGGTGLNTLDGGPGEDTASWTDSTTPVVIDLRTHTFAGAAGLDTLISIERYKGSPLDDTIDGSDGFDGLLNGYLGNDTINGHGGPDLIEGGGGDDTLLGESGNDMIVGGQGADVMDGGDGIDTLSYLAPGLPIIPPGVVLEPVTVNLATGLGTRGDAAGDVLSNFEILFGSGVPQGSTAPGGTGDDLTGSDHPETIHGMGGTDLIHGGGGNDVLYGDTAEADGPLMAGFDADTVYGDDGDDTILGQWDNDKLYGGDGTDMLDGGPGEDQLDGGDGNDSLLGGEGDDHLISNDLAGTDILDGGAGYNRLSADYSDKTTPLTFTVGPANAHAFPGGDQFAAVQTLGSLTTGSGNDIIRLAASKEPYLFDKNVDAGPGDDLVFADNRAQYSTGGQPRRTFDRLYGGDGVDTLSFEQSTGGITGNLATGGLGGHAAGITMTGFENLTGTRFTDRLTGNTGNNILNPFATLPHADGPETNDLVDGGGGVDTLKIDFSTLPEANIQGVSMTGNYTTGYESITLGLAYSPANITALLYYQGISRFDITGSLTNDVLFGETVGLSGADFRDRIFGLSGNDYIDSALGDDYVDGGEGNDTLLPGAGNDTVAGGPGNDTINFTYSDNFYSTYGTDICDAGPGDDFVRDAANPGNTSSSAVASSIFKFDGGDGFDTIQLDVGHMTTPFVFDERNPPAEVTLPGGGYLRNFERVRALTSGSGNDVLVSAGPANNTWATRDGNDIIRPGIGIDTLNAGNGDDLVMVDYSEGDAADKTGIIYNGSFSRHERKQAGTGVIVDQLSAGACERLHLTGTSKPDNIMGLNGDDRLFGGGGDDVISGGTGGNDWIDGGPGADSMTGGQGNDTYIVDNPGDSVVESGPQGTDTVRAGADYTLTGTVENLILTGSALNGTGNGSANIILGNALNNSLRGEAGNDTLNGGGGSGEVDRLHGGANADTFILGDGIERFYDDGNPLSSGLTGYAVIEDFTPSQSDRLRLTGSAARYFLGSSPVIGLPGTALYHDSNANSVLDVNTDELIAILVSPETLTAANTLTPAVYPPPVTPETIGLTGNPVVTTTNDGSGDRLTLTFSISDPMPAGALLELQASSDMGLTDAWQTIAGKNGSAAWTGMAKVTVSAAVNGRVTVTLTDIVPLSDVVRRFLRLKVSAP